MRTNLSSELVLSFCASLLSWTSSYWSYLLSWCSWHLWSFPWTSEDWSCPLHLADSGTDPQMCPAILPWDIWSWIMNDHDFGDDDNEYDYEQIGRPWLNHLSIQAPSAAHHIHRHRFIHPIHHHIYHCHNYCNYITIIIVIVIILIFNLDGSTSQPWFNLLLQLLLLLLQIQAALGCSAPLQLAASPGNCALWEFKRRYLGGTRLRHYLSRNYLVEPGWEPLGSTQLSVQWLPAHRSHCIDTIKSYSLISDIICQWGDRDSWTKLAKNCITVQIGSSFVIPI